MCQRDRLRCRPVTVIRRTVSELRILFAGLPVNSSLRKIGGKTHWIFLLWITRIYAILKLIFYEHFSFFEIPQKKNEVKILPDAKEKTVISLWSVFL